jgi:chorismate mutase
MPAMNFMITVLAVITVLSVSACDSAAGPTADGGPLRALVDVAAQRVQIADAVAAAKWGTGAPIDDPVREHAVLDSAAAKSRQLAIDPAVSIQVFADQIEASKAVQYGLYARWSAHPGQAPTARPDLGRVRPILDQITDELLSQLKSTQDVRAGGGCAAQLGAAWQHVVRARAFDPIHDDALGRALAPICRTRNGNSARPIAHDHSHVKRVRHAGTGSVIAHRIDRAAR